MAFQPTGSWWPKGLVKALKMKLTKGSKISFSSAQHPAPAVKPLEIPVSFSAPKSFSHFPWFGPLSALVGNKSVLFPVAFVWQSCRSVRIEGWSGAQLCRDDLFNLALDRDCRSFLTVLALCVVLQNDLSCMVQVRKQTINSPFWLSLGNMDRNN